MIKVATVGIWICAVAFGSLYFATQYRAGAATPQADKASYFGGFDSVKTDPINVPVIVDGAVQGYVISQLVYVIDTRVRSELKVPAGIFINDEIFRLFYGAYSNTRDIEKVKFDSLRQRIIDAVNQRIGKPVVHDILVSQFSYLTADEVRDLGLKDIAPPPAPVGHHVPEGVAQTAPTR
jgi:hypothetical protein